MGTNETIKQAVMVGLGLAVISAHTCFTELQEGKLATLRLAGLPLIRQWRLIHRADRPPTAAATSFKTFHDQEQPSLFPQLVPRSHVRVLTGAGAPPRCRPRGGDGAVADGDLSRSRRRSDGRRPRRASR